MKKIRTLVVDDEPLARARIVNLLKGFDYISLIGECKNGKEALEQIENYQPDLVFLDIQMPDFNGFDVLAKTEADSLPFIIFVTAYDQYALKAFDVHAIDYLLKPYDDERFALALEHARKHILLKQKAFLHQKMVRLIEDYQQNTEDQLRHLEIKDKGRSIYISLEDVYYLESHGNYLKIHLAKRYHLLRHTLQAIEEQLDPHAFLRIHRSLLINIHHIQQVRYEGNNQYRFTMKNDQDLQSSRGYKDQIQEYLEDSDLDKEVW